MSAGGQRGGRWSRRGHEPARRATAFEVIGAWLGVWTPPRDVEIPPVPVRKLVVGGVVGLVLVGAAIAVIAPRIDAGKQRAAERERRERAQRQAAERRRVIAEQRARRGQAAALRPPAGAGANERRAARARLLEGVEAKITADARRRVAAGELEGRPLRTECRSHRQKERPEDDLGLRRGIYDCLVVVSEIRATATNPAGSIGYPFRAVVDFAAFRFTWCKTNPVPGEQVIPDPRTVIELPPACRAPRDVVP